MLFLQAGGCKAELDNRIQRGVKQGRFLAAAVTLNLFLVAQCIGLYSSASPRYSHSLCRLRQRLWLYLERMAVFDRREYRFSAELKAAGWFLVHTASLELSCSLHEQSEFACAGKMHIDAPSHTNPSCVAPVAANAVPAVFISQQCPSHTVNRCQHQDKQIWSPGRAHLKDRGTRALQYPGCGCSSTEWEYWCWSLGTGCCAEGRRQEKWSSCSNTQRLCFLALTPA